MVSTSTTRASQARSTSDRVGKHARIFFGSGAYPATALNTINLRTTRKLWRRSACNHGKRAELVNTHARSWRGHSGHTGWRTPRPNRGGVEVATDTSDSGREP